MVPLENRKSSYPFFLVSSAFLGLTVLAQGFGTPIDSNHHMLPLWILFAVYTAMTTCGGLATAFFGEFDRGTSAPIGTEIVPVPRATYDRLVRQAQTRTTAVSMASRPSSGRRPLPSAPSAFPGSGALRTPTPAAPIARSSEPTTKQERAPLAAVIAALSTAPAAGDPVIEPTKEGSTGNAASVSEAPNTEGASEAGRNAPEDAPKGDVGSLHSVEEVDNAVLGFIARLRQTVKDQEADSSGEKYPSPAKDSGSDSE